MIQLWGHRMKRFRIVVVTGLLACLTIFGPIVAQSIAQNHMKSVNSSSGYAAVSVSDRDRVLNSVGSATVVAWAGMGAGGLLAATLWVSVASKRLKSLAVKGLDAPAQELGL